jgi:hypothetical protein
VCYRLYRLSTCYSIATSFVKQAVSELDPEENILDLRVKKHEKKGKK